MARKRGKMDTLQSDVVVSTDMPTIGQKVYYIDNRGTSGVLPAVVISAVSDNGKIDLSVIDHNGPFIASAEHDESMVPGTWYYPK